MWGCLYSPGSLSREIIAQIQNTYYLVNLVDNDYVSGSCLFKMIQKVIAKMDSLEERNSEFQPMPTQDLHIVSPPDMDVVEYVGEPLVVLGSREK